MRYLLILIVLLAACQRQPPKAQPAPSNPAQVEAHMLDHFGDATLAQTALINGDLGLAQEYAERLATHSPARGLPASSAGMVAGFQAYAASVASADNLEQAAASLASMAAQCGTCHRLSGALLPISVPAATPDSTGAAGMAGHIWAADRLWEGLIGPSDEAWVKGAEMLRAAPLDLPASLQAVDPEMIAPLRSQIRNIGDAAVTSFRPDEQAALYGRLLPVCAACHRGHRIDVGAD